MRIWKPIVVISALLFFADHVGAQSAPSSSLPADQVVKTKPWEFNLVLDGFLIRQGTSYFQPDIMADHGKLHLEGRYNNEALHTGSAWVGYNFNAGKKLVLQATPIVGGVFGAINGISPGCEASLTYKKVALSISNEYVFDFSDSAQNFYYTWPQLTYTPVSWFKTGLVAQRTRVYHTGLDVQRGFFAGFSHKNMEFTTYIFNLGWADPTAVLEIGFSF